MSLVRFRLWAFLFGKEKKLFIISYGVLAQSVEHLTFNQVVRVRIPDASLKSLQEIMLEGFFLPEKKELWECFIQI